MSKRIYITFGGAPYDVNTAQLVDVYKGFGVDELTVYDDAWLMGTDFYRGNKWIFDRQPQYGFGWCSWKPYIIAHTMGITSPGDMILYVDADTVPVANLSPIFELCERDGIVLFQAQGCDNRRFTQRECFRAMDCDAEQYYSAIHACGRFQCFRNDDKSHDFLREWWKWSIDSRCLFSDTIEMKRAYDRAYGTHTADIQLPEFFRHSSEQSVLTLLAERYGIPRHREACQFGWPPSPGQGLPEDKYPQLFFQDGRPRDKSDHSGSRFRNV